MRRLARVEQIGFDHIDIFDHVVMGFPIEGRPAGPYNAAMPILEALVTLGFLASATSRMTLGTEVLVLPQRDPTLVAKQVSTLDTLSGGRIRLGWRGLAGVGVEALGGLSHARARHGRGDRAPTDLLDGPQSRSRPALSRDVHGMEPKTPQGRGCRFDRRRLDPRCAHPTWAAGGTGRSRGVRCEAAPVDRDDTRHEEEAVATRGIGLRAWWRLAARKRKASAFTPSMRACGRVAEQGRWASAAWRSTPRRV